VALAKGLSGSATLAGSGTLSPGRSFRRHSLGHREPRLNDRNRSPKAGYEASTPLNEAVSKPFLRPRSRRAKPRSEAPTARPQRAIPMLLAVLYLKSMTRRIGAKGQVVIPKGLRDQAQLQPGDEVEFELRGDEIVLVARRAPAPLGGRFKRTGMAVRLLEDRAREPR